MLHNRSVFAAILFIASLAQAVSAAPSRKDVIKTYANIAVAKYEDALSTAKILKSAINQLIAEPTESNLKAARSAWLAARVPYQQTEVYRFGNAIVDDWEGRVNAWPLDEGMIDYVAAEYGVDSDENELYVANIVAQKTLKLSGREVDVSKITKALLVDVLHEAGGVEANVATGYHAIEFLLWGQDLNGNSPGSGNRPATDYDTKECTGGNCDRRAQYLKVVTEILIDDLTWIIGQWRQGGAARRTLLAGDGAQGVIAIFTGMGSLSYGELAGERMRLGLLLHDPEEEHDCFSDNTHNSHYYNAVGIQNVYLGRYKRLDGSIVTGASVSDLVKSSDSTVDARTRKTISMAIAKFKTLVNRAENVEAYDQMIAEGNTAGNAVVSEAIDALLDQTRDIERAIAVLKLKPIEFEGSDSLDAPENIAQ